MSSLDAARRYVFDNRIVRRAPEEAVFSRRRYARLVVRHAPAKVLGWTFLKRLGVPVVDTDDLRGPDRPGRYVEYGSPRELSFTYSEAGTTPAPIRHATGTYSFPQPFVKELHGATLLGPYPLTLTTGGEAITATVRGKRGWLYRSVADLVAQAGWGGAVEFVQRTPTESVDVAIAALSPKENFLHWVFEYLPLVRGLEAYEAETGTTPTVVLSPDAPDWMEESLRLVGFDGDVRRMPGGGLSVGRLVVPRFYHDYPPSPQVGWVRNRLLDAVDADGVGEEFPDRIYVSRADTDWRRVRNRDEVLDVLEEYGFEAVKPETLDVADQVRLFANAETIVGPHGANLTGVLYAVNASVLPLYPPFFLSYVLMLAEWFDLEYDFVVGEGTGERYGHGGEKEDFVVDPEAVRAVVERWTDP